jgi:hypothetical protein
MDFYVVLVTYSTRCPKINQVQAYKNEQVLETRN